MATLVELCAGTAVVSLCALSGRTVEPLTGYMGSKRRWQRDLVSLLVGRSKPSRAIIVDAGPWGDVWSVLRHEARRKAVVRILLEWSESDPQELWHELSQEPPHEDDDLRVAQYLWLQARSASQIPVWWNGSRWESPTGSRTERAHARGGRSSCTTTENRPRGRGIVRTSTIARRIAALQAVPWSKVTVLRDDVRSLDPVQLGLAGATVYFDPPYAKAPRYAVLLPREDVLQIAQRWAWCGCRVVVSEGEPLPLRGPDPTELAWWYGRLRRHGKRDEWVSCNFEFMLPREQLRLPGMSDA